MISKFKKIFSLLLAGLIFSTSNCIFAFNGEMPVEVESSLIDYVDMYNENLEENLEENLVTLLWKSYIGQFARIKKKLNSLNDSCDVMLWECSKFDSPEHRKLEKVLLTIKQNCDYNLIIKNYGDLCPAQSCSYGTIMQKQYETVKYIKYLLYFTRTGKQLYTKPYNCLGCTNTYRTRIKIYNMFQRDIEYINGQ